MRYEKPGVILDITNAYRGGNGIIITISGKKCCIIDEIKRKLRQHKEYWSYTNEIFYIGKGTLRVTDIENICVDNYDRVTDYR